jgi:hypothetical protein
VRPASLESVTSQLRSFAMCKRFLSGLLGVMMFVPMFSLTNVGECGIKGHLTVINRYNQPMMVKVNGRDISIFGPRSSWRFPNPTNDGPNVVTYIEAYLQSGTNTNTLIATETVAGDVDDYTWDVEE